MWVLLIALALVYFNSQRTSSVASAVPWGEDIKAALATAKQKGQPVLLKFHATWCGPCKMMESEVFARKDVGDALSKWVTVSVDGDKQRPAISDYRVEAYPTIVVLDSNGKEVFRNEGTMTAEELLGQVRAIEKALGVGTRPSEKVESEK
jgi:thiol:disulfide interchange protein